MAGRNNVEAAVKAIISHLKVQMPIMLAEIRTQRADSEVSTNPPENYFFYEKAQGYRAPFIYVIADNVDFNLEEGPNSLNQWLKINVSAIVEERGGDLTTLKAWRYQDALHKALDQADLQTESQNIRIIIRVVRASFSPLYRAQKDEEAIENVFRKEVVLELRVKQFQAH